MKRHWTNPSHYSLRKYRRISIQTIGVLLAALLIVQIAAFVMDPPSLPKKTPVTYEKKPIGHLVSIRFIQGGFIVSDKTEIKTAERFYVVYQTMPFKVGEALYIESRQLGDYLCRYDGNKCLQIVGGSKYEGTQ